MPHSSKPRTHLAVLATILFLAMFSGCATTPTTTAPETTAPETTAPETTAPETTATETVILEGEEIKVSPKKYPPTLRDVAYGPHERNKLDFWQGPSDKPTPVVFYIHGGGWIGGSKEANKGPYLELLDEGVSYVSINYRLARDGNVIPCSLDDAARALQFVRSSAEEWNIDPDRIVANGGSAGGCSSLWLAFHEDRADPTSEDPIARESTRLMGDEAGVAS